MPDISLRDVRVTINVDAEYEQVQTRLTRNVVGLVRGTDSVVANGLRVLGVACIFIALQPALGVIVLVPMLAVGLLLARYNRRVRPVYRVARRRLGDLSARLADNLNGIRVVQAFAQERRESTALEQVGRQLYDEQVQAVALRNRVFPFVRWIANSSTRSTYWQPP